MPFSPFDKLENREYSREEKIERLKNHVEWNKSIHGNRPRGKILINNGSVSKLYDADLPIPDGWVRGHHRRSANHEQ